MAFTFNKTSFGTIEVFQDGKRIATTTPALATQQYGYGRTLEDTSVTRQDSLQGAQVLEIGRTLSPERQGLQNGSLINPDNTLKSFEQANQERTERGHKPFTLEEYRRIAAEDIQSGINRTRTGIEALAQREMIPSQEETNFADIFSVLSGYIEELKRKGQIINPNIEITPEKIAEFTAKAESEISPFYSNQLKLARESLLRSVGYNTDEILRNEQNLERKYNLSLRRIGEESAETGFALSGRRTEAERTLAEETQQDIEEGRRKLEFQTGTQAQEFAQRFGQPDITPTIGALPRVRRFEAGFERPGGATPLYTLSPEVYNGLIGSEEFARRGAVQRRASELEEGFRTQEAIKQARTFNL